MFVLSSSPFSKALAIQDASAVIPDDHIMFVHDADLFPPCTLPDALRQTVVQGVQAVNLLLAYENQPVPGRAIVPALRTRPFFHNQDAPAGCRKNWGAGCSCENPL